MPKRWATAPGEGGYLPPADDASYLSMGYGKQKGLKVLI